VSDTFAIQPTVLAKAVADTVVISVDPSARQSGIFYWRMGRPWADAVLAALEQATDSSVTEAYRSLSSSPTSRRAYLQLQTTLLTRSNDRSIQRILTMAWASEQNSRIGYFIGSDYEPSQPLLDLRQLLGYPRRVSSTATSGVVATIAIPFRDQSTLGSLRLRNLTACLRALADQSIHRSQYEVIVVECDDFPRWRSHIEPIIDRYLFGPKPGTFNRSWGANCAVTNSPTEAPIVCILDADVLPDHEFVERNVTRFMAPGTGAHLPYRNMSCLDEASTSWAIDQRVIKATSDPETAGLRGFNLRRPPGCCIWVRRDIFNRIGGMDERYEGWGGEDNDLVNRLDVVAPIDHYDDRLLHMYHTPSSELKPDGTLVTSHIEPLSWRPNTPIGNLSKFEATGVPRQITGVANG